MSSLLIRACLFVCLFSLSLQAQQATAEKSAVPTQAATAPDTFTATVPEPAPTLSAAQAAAPKAPPSKLDLKDQRKREKEEARKQKEAAEEANYLKLQGDDIVAPTLDADGKPIELKPCSKKDKECIKKRKALLHRKKTGMKIENATLTVDGWTGKARLNFDISEVKFLYVSAPTIGTVIASLEHFPNSVEQKNALDGKQLTLTTPDGHTLQIAGEHDLIDKKAHSAYVAIDAGYTQGGRYPTFGYGSTARSPYNWPGVRPPTEQQQKVISKAPPLPQGMEAAQMNLPCQKVAPGEQPKAVKINGMSMLPLACPPASATPGAFAAGTRPPDGSGAASTGVAEVPAKN